MMAIFKQAMIFGLLSVTGMLFPVTLIMNNVTGKSKLVVVFYQDKSFAIQSLKSNDVMLNIPDSGKPVRAIWVIKPTNPLTSTKIDQILQKNSSSFISEKINSIKTSLNKEIEQEAFFAGDPVIKNQMYDIPQKSDDTQKAFDTLKTVEGAELALQAENKTTAATTASQVSGSQSTPQQQPLASHRFRTSRLTPVAQESDSDFEWISKKAVPTNSLNAERLLRDYNFRPSFLRTIRDHLPDIRKYIESLIDQKLTEKEIKERIKKYMDNKEYLIVRQTTTTSSSLAAPKRETKQEAAAPVLQQQSSSSRLLQHLRAPAKKAQ